MAKKTIPIELVVWANIQKWAMIRGITDDQIAAVLSVKNLADRKRRLFLTVQEMGLLSNLLVVEPERLLER